MLKLINQIRTYFFQKRAEKFLAQTASEHRFVNYDKAKTIFLLFQSDFTEKNPVIRNIIQQLQQDGKKVVAWGFIDKKEISTSILPDFRILHHQQTDFFHHPQQSYVNELQDLQFDLLIDLTLTSVLPLQYLALYANASCKAGLRKSKLPMYDFLLDIDNSHSADESHESEFDETYLFNQIIFYLKSIQTKD